ncbi:MAG TPA: glycosyltransferase N-terminal domain-containing protein [Fimbriimonadaceae bacterium]|nr:glycosyltransferase N-terminal domain-containing protein [Fimbriimonadaceae bacterium]
MFVLYNLLITLLSPLWAPWMWLRTRARKEAPNWGERFGNYDLAPRKDRKRIWVHAVSVGEVVACMPILRELRGELPDHEIVLSVTTSSGHQTARDKAAGLYDHLLYFPIDLARFELAAMQHVQPSVAAVMETELWMNFLWAAKVFDVRTLLINGRISDRSFRRSRRVAFFYKALLSRMDRCLMQSEKDAERIRALGASGVEVLGNCKFDQALAGLDADPAEWRAKLGLSPDLPTLVIGSTRGEMEEKFVFDALSLLGLDSAAPIPASPSLQVVHAPRHVERAADLVSEAKHRFGDAALRSEGKPSRYLVLDTYGELDKVYSVADVVIVGGGFDNLGGQNLVQPLAHGKPVLHGPHMQNFREVAAASVDAGASLVCATPADLASRLKELLADPTLRAQMGAAASQLVRSNAGASRRYAQAIAAEAKAFKP